MENYLSVARGKKAGPRSRLGVTVLSEPKKLPYWPDLLMRSFRADIRGWMPAAEAFF